FTLFFFFTAPSPPETYTLSLHDALPISQHEIFARDLTSGQPTRLVWRDDKIIAIEPAADAPKDIWIAPPLIDLQINGFAGVDFRSEEHTSELQSQSNLVCRLLLEKKKKQ